MKDYRDADVYDASSSFENYLKWSDEKEFVFSEIKKVIKEGQSFLDIGPGEGTLTQNFVPFFDEIILVEPAKKYNEQLKKRLPNATIINESFEDISINKKFNLILASHSFYYFKDREQAIEKIKGMLKEDGIFIVVINAKEGSFEDYYRRFRDKIIGSKYGKSINVDTILPLFKKEDFNIKKNLIYTNIIFPTIEDSINMLDFWYNVPLSEIKEETKNQIRKYLKERFGNDKIHFTRAEMMIVATPSP